MHLFVDIITSLRTALTYLLEIYQRKNNLPKFDIPVGTCYTWPNIFIIFKYSDLETSRLKFKMKQSLRKNAAIFSAHLE